MGVPFPAIMTFNRDGTLTAYANPPGTGPLDTPEAGIWQREPGSQNYSFHDIAYFYDENGAFAGSRVRHRQRPSHQRQQLQLQRHDPGLRR